MLKSINNVEIINEYVCKRLIKNVAEFLRSIKHFCTLSHLQAKKILKSINKTERLFYERNSNDSVGPIS